MFERKVIRGENMYSNLAFQDSFGIKEADESWNWENFFSSPQKKQ
ncbi:hypothetical protein [Bacillus cereus]|nr:hypothetical protein [Bacillus cereus]